MILFLLILISNKRQKELPDQIGYLKFRQNHFKSAIFYKILKYLSVVFDLRVWKSN